MHDPPMFNVLPFGTAYHIVQTDVIVISQCDEMMRRNFLYTQFVFGILLLRGAEDLSDIFLGQIGILPQISQASIIVHFKSP